MSNFPDPPVDPGAEAPAVGDVPSPGSSLPPPPDESTASTPATRTQPSYALVLIVAAISLLVGGAIGAGIVAAVKSGSSTSASSKTAKSSSGSATTTSTLRATTTTTRLPYTPTPTDFQIGIIETKRACFGSAGCNITYRIDPTYIGAQTPDPSKTYTVIYEVLGGDSPMTENFTLRGTSAQFSSSDFISTPPNPTLTARVVRVL